VQLCGTHRESEMAETPGVRIAARQSENIRKNSSLN
jgi:hypothetical protein